MYCIIVYAKVEKLCSAHSMKLESTFYYSLSIESLFSFLCTFSIPSFSSARVKSGFYILV